MNRLATAGELVALLSGMDPAVRVMFRIEPWASVGSGVVRVKREPVGGVVHVYLAPVSGAEVPVLSSRKGEV